MNNVVMDATILSSLMSCGRMTDNRFNQNWADKEGKSNSLEAGSIVHAFFEYYYQGLIDGKTKSDSLDLGVKAAKLFINGCPICKDLPIDSIGVPACGHKIGDYIGVRNTPAKSGKQDIGHGMRDYIGYDHCLDTCLQYLVFYQADSWTPLNSEHTKGEVIYQDDSLRVLWKAKFDLIVDTNQQILPVDHKTMKQRRDSLSLNNQFMGQAILTKSRNVIINKIGFQTSLKPNERFERAMMSYSKARLDEWQNVIVPYWANQMISYAKNQYWPPNYTHCENKYGKCSFAEVCANDPNMRDETMKLYFIKSRPWDVTND